MGVSGAVNQNQEYGLVLIHFSVRGAARHAEQQQRLQRISIRAPREGSDDSEADQILCEDDFNPRSPRGERPYTIAEARKALQFQSTLPARGATDRLWSSAHQPRYFNPRSPRGERLDTRTQGDKETRSSGFQSTLPARGATGVVFTGNRDFDISIHAPREGSDSPDKSKIPDRNYFNPRSPRGERRICFRTIFSTMLISIHAPREGSDQIP